MDTWTPEDRARAHQEGWKLIGRTIYPVLWNGMTNLRTFKNEYDAYKFVLKKAATSPWHHRVITELTQWNPTDNWAANERGWDIWSGEIMPCGGRVRYATQEELLEALRTEAEAGDALAIKAIRKVVIQKLKR